MTNARKRRLKIRHLTTYQYSQSVERSAHKLHLRPIDDWKQTVLEYKLTVNPQVPTVEYEDVFGNFATRFDISVPYQELIVQADSTVELLDTDPFDFVRAPQRPVYPVVWMPWEMKMLGPYLTPSELPDTQLGELYAYAMSFVENNKRDLLETLFAINLTLFREYTYQPGSTRLETTAFEVLTRKCGVCQDFANLFITLARLLGLPARYVCGYVFTGNTGHARARSDASHAWVQLYIPNVGWKGFDPTNGILPTTDHVRVSVGRHFRDTTPTSGTIFSPAQESMNIDVEVCDLDDPQQKQQQ